MVIEMKGAPFGKNLLIEFGRLHVTVNKELAYNGNPEYTMANQRLCKNSWTSIGLVRTRHVNKGESIA